MPDNVCEKCGHELKVGDWPFCPHEPGTIHGYFNPFTPYFDPHISAKGEWIESREQRRLIMKQNNLEFAGRPYGGEVGPTEF